ncbi:putative bifunctional diguanylate cyclase/phosphodiesterase [Croceibacterium selenioxidans]|nr:bifunctional diguanylate cyclase/phosphodiesterase [Croceibacterium selenioxidans]
MRPAVLVIAPVAVLSLISATVLAMLLNRAGADLSSSQSILVTGGLAYGTAVILLIRFGLSSVGKLEDLGLTDTLAAMPNRRALHLDYARAAPGTEKALALLDLDGFKSVNDQYGHFVGDKLIKECAKILAEVCSKDGRAYRLGGDEFAILVIGPIAGNILEGICHTLLARLGQSVTIDERKLLIGASVGLSRSSRRDELTSSELLRRSDMAMYVSKDAGRNRCTWFSDDFDRNRDVTQQVEAELREALRLQEFRVAYQPLVDAKSGDIVAVEALLRWERADGSTVSPGVFVPIAEKCGLIYQIGLWVLRTACREAMAWDEIKLSINVSPVQLRNPEFPVELGHILEETGFPPSRLELEVTETYLVSDPVVANRNLDVIRKFGVGIALDDFGTGYASIGFLRNFRFEKLKLDRTMIVDAGLDSGSLAMMASSIAVARAMDMEVTAEGVETKAQADLVRTAGCDQIQGWYYYKAISAGEIRGHLDEIRDRNNTLGIGEAHGHVG